MKAPKGGFEDGRAFVGDKKAVRSECPREASAARKLPIAHAQDITGSGGIRKRELLVHMSRIAARHIGPGASIRPSMPCSLKENLNSAVQTGHLWV